MLLSRTAAIFVTVSQVLTAKAYVAPIGCPIPPSAGCGKELPEGQAVGSVTNVTIVSGGLERSYLLSVPPKYNASAPTSLIFSYHGGSRNASSQLQLDQLTNPEFNTASMLIYPQGVDDTWQGVPGVTTNDVQFTTDILTEVETLYCINASRVTATGKSDGGGMCNVLACDPVTSTLFAAFAPVSGAYYVDTLPCNASTVEIPCSAARLNIPIVAFHGGDDTTIPYSGGERKDECLPTIPHFIQEWAIRDGLGSSNITTPLATDTVVYSFGKGTEKGLVELIYESNIGHDWPSTTANADNILVGQHVASYNATPIILAFFEAHSLGLCGDSVGSSTIASTGVLTTPTSTGSPIVSATGAASTKCVSGLAVALAGGVALMNGLGAWETF